MRLRPPFARALALALCVLAVGAACGGADDGADAFEAEVVAARDRTDSALAQVTQPRSLDDLLVRMRTARDEIATAAGEVGSAEAPENLTEEQRALAAALSGLASEIGGTATTLEELGPDAANIRTLDFENWNRVQAALEALREEGVEVEPLGRHGGEQGGTGTGSDS